MARINETPGRPIGRPIGRIEPDSSRREIRLEDLPMQSIIRKLEQQFNPDGDTFLLPKSVGSVALSTLTTLEFDAIAAADVPNNSLFRDSADDKLKFKDNGGVVNAFY